MEEAICAFTLWLHPQSDLRLARRILTTIGTKAIGRLGEGGEGVFEYFMVETHLSYRRRMMCDNHPREKNT